MLLSLSDAEFALFQALIHRETGIYLAETKKPLLVARLGGRLRATRSPSFAHYFRRAKADPDELVRMLDCITTNETHFFREPKHFEFLEKKLLPAWSAQAAAGKRSTVVRAWSAGCSTGQEPYSLAMSLLHHFGDDERWAIEIVATDLSTAVLDKAGHGVWPIAAAAEIPERYLKAFMRRGIGPQEGKMKAANELRRLIRFRHANLNDESDMPPGKFDLVFCRNVLIYFRGETKKRVVQRLVERIAPGGYLFLGHAEALSSGMERVRAVHPTVYRLS
jgi:chemotaxis protein methyltransferase CheR